MRYAILSDIHSNLEAFTAVVKAIDSMEIDTIVSLGDVVGYNANPNECIEIIKKRNITCLMGNHDSRAAAMEEPDDFNEAARAAIYWTRKKLSEENRGFLKTLDRKITIRPAPTHPTHPSGGFPGGSPGAGAPSFAAFHGWMNSTDDYILTEDDASVNFRLMGDLRLSFFGHTHVRICYIEKGGVVETSFQNPLKIEKNFRYLINPGAVGQPRDNDPMASFLVYDTQIQEVTFFRTAYDIGACQKKIIAAGLPLMLAERLRKGW